jgi:hypothetical protein
VSGFARALHPPSSLGRVTLHTPVSREVAGLSAVSAAPSAAGGAPASPKLRMGRVLRRCGELSGLAALLSLCAEQAAAPDDQGTRC